MNIQLEPTALTPYYYEVVTVVPNNCTEEPTVNYNEYHLFCLRTRLFPFLRDNHLTKYSLEFIPVQRASRIYIGIRLTDAGEPVKLTSRDQQKLQATVDEITTVNPTSCLLFSADVIVQLDVSCAKTLSPVWVMSLLPYLPIDPITNPYVNQGNLYVDLSIYPDYPSRYHQMYDQIIRDLRDLYRRGAMVCNRTFAEKWDLWPYITLGLSTISSRGELLEDQAILESTDQAGVYLPRWQNSYIAPDRVSFLMERMAGLNNLSINLTNLPIKRDRVIDLFQNLVSLDVTFYLERDNLVISTGREWSLDRLLELTNRLVDISSYEF